MLTLSPLIHQTNIFCSFWGQIAISPWIARCSGRSVCLGVSVRKGRRARQKMHIRAEYYSSIGVLEKRSVSCVTVPAPDPEHRPGCFVVTKAFGCLGMARLELWLEGYDSYRGSCGSDPRDGRDNEDDWMCKLKDVHFSGVGT
ncbi:unnamed protein product [Lepidochelys olivacea]